MITPIDTPRYSKCEGCGTEKGLRTYQLRPSRESFPTKCITLCYRCVSHLYRIAFDLAKEERINDSRNRKSKTSSEDDS